MATLVQENARRAMDQYAYLRQLAEMKAEQDSLMAKRGKIEAELVACRARKAQIGGFMETLDTGMMNEFDEEVFRVVVESLTAGRDGGTVLSFY